ncbi:hypothetical protein ACIF6K_23565 [Streptomyces sp. NPDC085942]|uniref:hypothetical protein n=1 Tax=Streptomyces sp. NPDC085942 TaxID=3365743 RepID=UPI0037CDD1CC
MFAASVSVGWSMTWAWASMSPGVRVRPSASMTKTSDGKIAAVADRGDLPVGDQHAGRAGQLVRTAVEDPGTGEHHRSPGGARPVSGGCRVRR